MALPKDAGLRIYAEILRRKGKSVLDAQTMSGAEPWYVTLTWNGHEGAAFQRWFKSWCMRTLGVSARAFEHDRWTWTLMYGLHRRDICDDPQHPHDEATERVLPRARLLSVKAAIVALSRNRWPK
jgi:hypothetical protein